MGLTNSEKETIILYDEEGSEARVLTYHKALINRIERIRANDARIAIVREGDGWKEYSLPKKAIKVQMPREFSEEERAKLAERAKRLHLQKGQTA